jgi:hypothetical protein
MSIIRTHDSAAGATRQPERAASLSGGTEPPLSFVETLAVQTKSASGSAMPVDHAARSGLLMPMAAAAGAGSGPPGGMLFAIPAGGAETDTPPPSGSCPKSGDSASAQSCVPAYKQPPDEDGSGKPLYFRAGDAVKWTGGARDYVAENEDHLLIEVTNMINVTNTGLQGKGVPKYWIDVSNSDSLVVIDPFPSKLDREPLPSRVLEPETQLRLTGLVRPGQQNRLRMEATVSITDHFETGWIETSAKSAFSDPKPAPRASDQATAKPAPLTSDQAMAKLAQLAGDSGLNWPLSIVDLMKLLHLPSSIDDREKLALNLKCPPSIRYGGPPGGDALMNGWLHTQLIEIFAKNGGEIPKNIRDLFSTAQRN